MSLSDVSNLDHETFTRAQWRSAVRRNNTELGYTDWVHDRIAKTSTDLNLVNLNARDSATIIAALRFYVAATALPVRFQVVEPLMMHEVDDLCQRLKDGQSCVVQGYLLTHPDGKVATITRQTPGPRCALKITRLVAVE